MDDLTDEECSGLTSYRVPIVTAWIVSAAVAVVYTAVVLNAAVTIGKLAYPISYDDVLYFNDALSRLEFLYTKGLVATIVEYTSNPPHSLVTVFLAGLSYSLFGLTQWSGYLANAIFVMVAVFLILREFRNVPAVIGVLLALAALSAPIFNVVVTEQRPDAMTALSTAFGVLVLVGRPWALGPARNAIAVGCCAGFALLAKPPVFHLTLALFGAAALMKSVVEYRAGATLLQLRRSWVASVGLALGISAIYFAFALPRTIAYVWQNTLGSQGKYWAFEMSLEQSLAYYLVGAGGKLGIGPWIYVSLFVAFGAVVVAIVRPAYRGGLASFGAVLLAAYLIVSLPANKTPFIGLVVSALILCGLVAAVAWGMPKIYARSRALSWIATAVIVVFSASNFPFINVYHPLAITPSQKQDAAAAWSIAEDLLDAIYKVENAGLSVSYLSSPQLSNEMSLALQALLQRRPNVKLLDIGLGYDPGLLSQVLSLADIVVAYPPENESVITWLPSGDKAFRATSIEAVERDPRFQKHSTVVNPFNGDEIFVYRKHQPFDGLVSVSGMNDIEGPYPQWNLPKVRWALAPQASARFSGMPEAKGLLSFEVRSAELADQTMAVSIPGGADVTYSIGAEFMSAEIPVEYDKSGNLDVNFLFAKGGEAQRAVLFSKLTVSSSQPQSAE